MAIKMRRRQNRLLAVIIGLGILALLALLPLKALEIALLK
jgi:cytochrome c-type biogenesis protein CcmE